MKLLAPFIALLLFGAAELALAVGNFTSLAARAHESADKFVRDSARWVS